ncbi:MAG: N-acetylglucosamine-6-phosphate deacetylase [Chlamydiales bacterium]
MKSQFLIFLCSIFLQSIYAQEFMPKIEIYNSPEEMAYRCAREVADEIRVNKKTVLGLATGSTPIHFYKVLKNIILEENIDVSEVITFNLDEYVGIAQNHPESYHTYMYKHFFSDLMQTAKNPRGFSRRNIHIPKGSSGKKGAEQYEALIQKEGPIDIQIVGVGTNGHIGFAEPGTPFFQTTQVVRLTENTRKDNARFFKEDIDSVPTHAISMGIKTILQAKKIFFLATGEEKADIMKKILSGPITTAIPATALRMHPKVEMFLDEKAASKVKICCFTNGRVLRDHKLEEGELWVQDGKIIPPQERVDLKVDVDGLIVAPGYIDLQLLGGFGIDFTSTPERVAEVAKELPRYGVTSFVAGIVSTKKENYQKIVSQLQPQKIEGGAELLGIHFEGPFFNPTKRGAHDPLCICHWEGDQEFYADLRGVKIVTLAPEVPGGMQLIEWLREKGIVVSIGHSSADFAKTQQAISLGAGLATHLFNAMTPFQHREPGIIGAVLNDPNMYYSIILDDNHLHPATVQLAWRSNPKGMILMTDAMSAFGLPTGVYPLGSMEVEIRCGAAFIHGTETLAGSILSMDRAVQNMHRLTGCSIVEAVEAATIKPAKILGLEGKKGTLDVGADADIIFLDDNLVVQGFFENQVLR